MNQRFRSRYIIFLLLGSVFFLLSGSPIQEKVVYKIQIASFLTEYPPEEIRKDLELTQPLTVHYQNGRFKYCIGNYNSFEEATADLANVRVDGAYVVRIPVSASDVVVSQPLTEQSSGTTGQAVTQPTITVMDTVWTIQLAASKVFLQPDAVQRKAGIADEVRYFTKDGWYKYITGRFNSQEAAVARLNQLQVNGFVTYELAARTVVAPATSEPAVTEQTVSGDTLSRLPVTAEDLNELYSQKIREANAAFDREEWLVARKLYREALVLSPEKNLPKDKMDEIDSILKKENSKLIARNIPNITYLIVILIVVMILVLTITLILRTRRQRSQRREQSDRQSYQDSITEYLFDENARQPDNLRRADSPQKKQLLIDEIMQLYANLSGEISNRLRELYIDLGLDNESVQKTKSPQWHIRAKGFRELAQMNVKTVNDEIERCLNSPNDVLRMEAQLAMVRLNYEDPFSFLDKLDKAFTAWEQLHVYEMIQRYQIPVPDFTRWIHSRNLSIVVFCIRMIRAFKQADSIKTILPLLTHSNPEIREETIVTLGDLQNIEILPVLKERYNHESEDARVLIIKAMSKIPDESNIEFLRGILEPSNELRLEAADALARIESFGVRGIETILKRSDEDLQAVARHILDNKIQRR